jgi:phosphoglycolate phosphatase-like HAD superfamily hydrolase
MRKVIFDIDGVIIDLLNMVLELYNGKFNDNYKCYQVNDWDFSDFPLENDAVFKLFCEAYSLPEEEVRYYPMGVDLLKKYKDEEIIFITGREKQYNNYTKRSLNHIFEENDLDILYTIYNSKTKYDEFEELYRDCLTYYEDSPKIFPRLYNINKNGFLVTHNYNRELWNKFPTVDICQREEDIRIKTITPSLFQAKI